jgi:hypothetical protein
MNFGEVLMVAAIRNQKSYDHRLKELVCTTGRFDIASRIGVPRSTIYGWRKQNHSKVVSLKTHDLSIDELESEVLRLSFNFDAYYDYSFYCYDFLGID